MQALLVVALAAQENERKEEKEEEEEMGNNIDQSKRGEEGKEENFLPRPRSLCSRRKWIAAQGYAFERRSLAAISELQLNDEKVRERWHRQTSVSQDRRGGRLLDC